MFGKAFCEFYKMYNDAKKVYKFKSTDEVIDLFIQTAGMTVQRSKGEISESDKSVLCTDIEMFRDELDGKCIHYFVDDENLKEFLLKTELRDLDFYRNLDGITRETEESVGYGCYEGITAEEREEMQEFGNRRLTFVLHFKNEERCPRYMLIYNNKKDHAFLGCIVYEGDKKHFYHCGFWDKKDAKKTIKEFEYIRLGINFLFYIQAFPETVREGIPKGYKVTEGYKNKRVCVKTSSKLIADGDKRKVTAHFRRGYFRYLGSEWYKAKRGKTIFVDATVVNSKNNKTVEEKNA